MLAATLSGAARRRARRRRRPRAATANQYSQDSGTIMYRNVYFRGAALLSIWLLPGLLTGCMHTARRNQQSIRVHAVTETLHSVHSLIPPG